MIENGAIEKHKLHSMRSKSKCIIIIVIIIFFSVLNLLYHMRFGFIDMKMKLSNYNIQPKSVRFIDGIFRKIYPTLRITM